MKNVPENELFSAYLDGELTAEERADVERLLASSHEARQLMDELRALSTMLRSLPARKIQEDLSERVLRIAERRLLTDAMGPEKPESLGADASLWQVIGQRALRPRVWVWSVVAVTAAILMMYVNPEQENRRTAWNSSEKTAAPTRPIAKNDWPADLRLEAPPTSPTVAENNPKASAENATLAAAKSAADANKPADKLAAGAAAAKETTGTAMAREEKREASPAAGAPMKSPPPARIDAERLAASRGPAVDAVVAGSAPMATKAAAPMVAKGAAPAPAEQGNAELKVAAKSLAIMPKSRSFAKKSLAPADARFKDAPGGRGGALGSSSPSFEKRKDGQAVESPSPLFVRCAVAPQVVQGDMLEQLLAKRCLAQRPIALDDSYYGATLRANRRRSSADVKDEAAKHDRKGGLSDGSIARDDASRADLAASDAKVGHDNKREGAGMAAEQRSAGAMSSGGMSSQNEALTSLAEAKPGQGGGNKMPYRSPAKPDRAMAKMVEVEMTAEQLSSILVDLQSQPSDFVSVVSDIRDDRVRRAYGWAKEAESRQLQNSPSQNRQPMVVNSQSGLNNAIVSQNQQSREIGQSNESLLGRNAVVQNAQGQAMNAMPAAQMPATPSPASAPEPMRAATSQSQTAMPQAAAAPSAKRLLVVFVLEAAKPLDADSQKPVADQAVPKANAAAKPASPASSQSTPPPSK
jgi:hypothetical protein